MDTRVLPAAVIPLVIFACSVAPLSPTSTPQPTATQPNTATPEPSKTLTPTRTRTPTPTYEPAPQINAGIIESTLRADGYKRYPFTDTSTGEDAFFWDNGSGIVLYTYVDGLEINVLNDPNNLPGRLKLLDRAIEVIAPLFAQGAISDLRGEVHAYADRVITVTGDPTVLDYGQEPWLGKLMEFNAYSTSIRNGRDVLPVYLRLLFREYKCDMRKYTYCYFTEMPSMTYTGGATLTFLSIWIEFPDVLDPSSG